MENRDRAEKSSQTGGAAGQNGGRVANHSQWLSYNPQKVAPKSSGGADMDPFAKGAN